MCRVSVSVCRVSVSVCRVSVSVCRVNAVFYICKVSAVF